MSSKDERYYGGVKEVRIVDEVDAVNANLAQGWEILRIADKTEDALVADGISHFTKPVFILGLRYVTGEPFKPPAEPTPTERGDKPTLCKYCKSKGEDTPIDIESYTKDDGTRGWRIYEKGTTTFHNCPYRPKR